MNDPQPPPNPKDQCAACGRRRWAHDMPTDSGPCPEFVEISWPTRMAEFVHAGQRLAIAMTRARAAMTEALRAFHDLHFAMQHAGLLPEAEQPEQPAGRHHLDDNVLTKLDAAKDRLADALDVPREILDTPPGAGHWSQVELVRDVDITEVIPALTQQLQDDLAAQGAQLPEDTHITYDLTPADTTNPKDTP